MPTSGDVLLDTSVIIPYFRGDERLRPRFAPCGGRGRNPRCSSGPFREGEKKVFPRERFWNRILDSTGAPGIHFEDYPSLSHFQCPEFSHLTPSDAIVYTKSLVEIIEKEKGWSFNNKASVN